MAFVHLHTHSEYSLLDGANRVHDLVDHVQRLGMDSLAAFLGQTEFTEEELEQLQERLQEEIDKNLGVLDYIIRAIDEWLPQWYKDADGWVTDKIAGAIGDSVADAINNTEIPQSVAPLLTGLCENP